MMNRYAIILCLLTFSSQADFTFAQSTLPRGIGLIQFGQRFYEKQEVKYGPDGHKVPLGQRFLREFSGHAMYENKVGDDLKRLANELVKYEGNDPDKSELLDRIHLGRLSGDVTADIKVQTFGVAYGITDNLTAFIGLPLINALVRTRLSFSGDNNAREIKEELGDLAYDELKDGLDEAAALDDTRLKQEFIDKGYAPVEKWSHKGIGDLRLGLKNAYQHSVTKHIAVLTLITPQLDVPTGYIDDPDVLTDVNLGKGYYSFGIGLSETLVINKNLLFGIDLFYAENFNTKVGRRVPVDNEVLPLADRKTNVRLKPGDDSDIALTAGYTHDWFSAGLRRGIKRHFADSYSGSLQGNYEFLSEESATYQYYQQLQFSITTANAYKKGMFPVPFIISMISHHPLEAKNSPDERYYELSLTSFFPTPYASDSTPKSRVRSR